MKIQHSIALVVLSLSTVPGARAAVLAGPIINAANAHTYYLLSTNTWTASKAEARGLGGHLVTINDAAENQWVLNSFSPLTGVPEAKLWIGLNDAANERQFVWASGEPVASGDVSLSSGRLLPSAGFNPQAGQIYTIVEKTCPGPITNEFLGPEGTVTTLNGMPVRISYVGGDGNDVTLTVVTPVPIVLSGIQRSFDTQSVFSYSADVGLRYAVERSATLTNWTTIRSDTANVNPMTVTDTAATNRMNFYRVRRLANP
ncbi:MAG TPA: lectin-like protein [Candidatus Saccharimonadales bacterium]|nr:lectin-like protein [Candidatus Saccharimonadales bacterium]